MSLPTDIFSTKSESARARAQNIDQLHSSPKKTAAILKTIEMMFGFVNFSEGFEIKSFHSSTV